MKMLLLFLKMCEKFAMIVNKHQVGTSDTIKEVNWSNAKARLFLAHFHCTIQLSLLLTWRMQNKSTPVFFDCHTHAAAKGSMIMVRRAEVVGKVKNFEGG